MLVNHIYGAGGTSPTPPSKYKKMTAIIDLSNPDPATCVTYADDAVGMAAGSDKWDEFFGHYPCLFKDGAEVGKLERNNFNVFEDGSPADITTGEAGDVMICFPRRGLMMWTQNNLGFVQFTDDPDSPDFTYNAHTAFTAPEGEDKRREAFYYGAYLASNISSDNPFASVCGRSYYSGANISTYKDKAAAKGDGYGIIRFYNMVYLQAMYILCYKNLNSQAVLGLGARSKIPTGGTETKGMDWGSLTDDTQHVKLFGIEDFYGNAAQFFDGAENNGNRLYTDLGNDIGYCGYCHSYIKAPYLTPDMGFIPKQGGGTAETFFCDYYQGTDRYKYGAMGYRPDRSNENGVFGFAIDYSGAGNELYTSRLMYL